MHNKSYKIHAKSIPDAKSEALGWNCELGGAWGGKVDRNPMLFGHPVSDHVTSEVLENDPMGSQMEPNMETEASKNGSKQRG